MTEATMDEEEAARLQAEAERLQAEDERDRLLDLLIAMDEADEEAERLEDGYVPDDGYLDDDDPDRDLDFETEERRNARSDARLRYLANRGRRRARREVAHWMERTYDGRAEVREALEDDRQLAADIYLSTGLDHLEPVRGQPILDVDTVLMAVREWADAQF